MHLKCLEIARRVVDFRKANAGNTIDAGTDDVPAMNLGRLHEIYRARCDAQSGSPDYNLHYPPFNVVWERHRFFGFASSLWGDDWHEGDPEISVSLAQMFGTYLIFI